MNTTRDRSLLSTPVFVKGGQHNRQRRYFGRRTPTLTKSGIEKRRRGLVDNIASVIRNSTIPKGYVMVPGFKGYYAASRSGSVFSLFMGRNLKTQKTKNGYLTVSLRLDGGGKSPIELHRVIMLAFKGMPPEAHEVDHINRIRTDCRLSNLRYCLKSQNSHRGIKPRRKLPYRGILWLHGGWCARIRHWKHRLISEPLPNQKEAAEKYDELAVKHFGIFATTNKSLGLLP